MDERRSSTGNLSHPVHWQRRGKTAQKNPQEFNSSTAKISCFTWRSDNISQPFKSPFWNKVKRNIIDPSLSCLALLHPKLFTGFYPGFGTVFSKLCPAQNALVQLHLSGGVWRLLEALLGVTASWERTQPSVLDLFPGDLLGLFHFVWQVISARSADCSVCVCAKSCHCDRVRRNPSPPACWEVKTPKNLSKLGKTPPAFEGAGEEISPQIWLEMLSWQGCPVGSQGKLKAWKTGKCGWKCQVRLPGSGQGTELCYLLCWAGHPGCPCGHASFLGTAQRAPLQSETFSWQEIWFGHKTTSSGLAFHRGKLQPRRWGICKPSTVKASPTYFEGEEEDSISQVNHKHWKSRKQEGRKVLSHTQALCVISDHNREVLVVCCGV